MKKPSSEKLATETNPKFKENEAVFNAIAKQTTEGLIVANMRGKFLFVNKAFCQMSGYTEEELLQLHVFELMDEDQHGFFIEREKYFGTPIKVSLNHKNGSKYFVEILGDNLIVDGELHVLGMMREITDKVKWEEKLKNLNKVLEHEVEDRTAKLDKTINELNAEIERREIIEKQLQESLEIKQLLLNEITHRVKNNLQVVSSILRIKKEGVISPEAKAVCSETSDRIYSMALIHETLYKTSDFSKVPFKAYIDSLIKHLMVIYGEGRTQFINECDKTILPIDIATSCGMIASELITNSLKYACTGENSSEKNDCWVRVSMKKKGKNVTFEVADNGDGLPSDFSLENSKSLGMNIVTSLVHQIDGKLKIEQENGLKICIEFALRK
ncbi:MAG: histidine kinase dimerization/phosphoacceptor domain -containing protein [Crocinitomicaceae bacterium]|nr:PAS domain S-box protein [Crocinitomicaceae bacterium]